VVLKNGRYGNVPIETITATKKVVNVAEHYSTERLAPKFDHLEGKPLFVMTGDDA
jgi:6-phosphofructokinase 1